MGRFGGFGCGSPCGVGFGCGTPCGYGNVYDDCCNNNFVEDAANNFQNNSLAATDCNVTARNREVYYERDNAYCANNSQICADCTNACCADRRAGCAAANHHGAAYGGPGFYGGGLGYGGRRGFGRFGPGAKLHKGLGYRKGKY